MFSPSPPPSGLVAPNGVDPNRPPPPPDGMVLPNKPPGLFALLPNKPGFPNPVPKPKPPPIVGTVGCPKPVKPVAGLLKVLFPNREPVGFV